MRPEQNGQHFADDIFICIIVNEIFFFDLFFMKSVPRGPVDNKSALYQQFGTEKTASHDMS